MPDTQAAPSITIGFAVDVTRATLQARPGLEADLRRLALAFQTSAQRSPGILEVDLDELLTNLSSLNNCPHQGEGDVHGEPPLQALVVDSLHDAQAVTTRLEAIAESAAITAESVLDR